jgi:hypothetical protein
MDLAERLDAAGVPADRAPTLDEGLDAVWPLAKRLARLEKTAGNAGAAAARARNATLDCTVARFAAAAGGRPAAMTEQVGTRPRWQKFDAAEWHVALVQGTAWPATSGLMAAGCSSATRTSSALIPVVSLIASALQLRAMSAWIRRWLSTPVDVLGGAVTARPPNCGERPRAAP